MSRLSGASLKSKFNVIDSLTEINAMLENLTEKVIDRAEATNQQTMETWTEKILNLSKETAKAYQESNEANKLINEIETKQIKNFASNQVIERIKEVKVLLQKRSSNYDGSSAESYKKLKKMLSDSNNDDDEDLVVSEKLKEADFKCSYSGMQFVEPMKNANCIHRVSKASLTSMLNNSRAQTAKCPMSGCPKMWTKDSATFDKMFQSKMERFLRTQAIQLQTLSQRAEAATVSLDDDE